MATTAAPKIVWPKNLNIQGQLSFTLFSEEDLDRVVEWRSKKDLPKPEFDDRIGGFLLLKPAQWAKAVGYLTETYLPFARTLQEVSNGKKGIDPDLIDELLEQAKSDKWEVGVGKKVKPNMPLRRLNAKDIENSGGAESPFVGKIKFAGPYEGAPIEKAAIIKDETAPLGERVVSLKELIDDDVIPESRRNPDTLWWGSNWNFRTNLRFNAFDKASVGVTAYATKLYLLPHLGLPVSGGGDAAIIDDGDDWTDED